MNEKEKSPPEEREITQGVTETKKGKFSDMTAINSVQGHKEDEDTKGY